MTGEIVLSFPASAVQMLNNNSTPSELCLRIKNTDNIEEISTNQQLIVEYVSPHLEVSARFLVILELLIDKLPASFCVLFSPCVVVIKLSYATYHQLVVEHFEYEQNNNEKLL